MKDLFDAIDGFDWDKFNAEKIFSKHSVAVGECEEVFLDEIILVPDEKHSHAEQRYNVLGSTFLERLLFVVFTIRKNRIRIISARPMNRKEREIYHEKIKENTEI
jgi:uncharacterized DUF497 family protein